MQRLEQTLQQELLGFFSPGTPIAAAVDRGKEAVRATFLHESTHRGVTRGSTLGSIAMFCGLVKVYSRDAVARVTAGKYVEAFCSKSFWVQEGAATASELVASAFSAKHQREPFLSSNDEILSGRPRSYAHAASDILAVAIPICQAFGWTNPSHFCAALLSAVGGVAIACLSPEIDQELVAAALHGDRTTFIEPLSRIWERFETIRYCRSEPIIELLDSKMPVGEDSRAYVLMQFHRDVAVSLCEAAQLDYSKPPNPTAWVENYVPDLARHICSLANLSLEELEASSRLQSLLRHHILIPKSIKGTRVQLDDFSLVDSLKHSGICIIEATSIEGIRVALIVHVFSNNGEYVQSIAIDHSIPSRQVLEHLLEKLLQQDGTACYGVVVGRETVQDYLSELLEGLPMVRLPLFNLGPDSVAEVERVCEYGSVELQKIALSSDEICWQVALAGLGEDCREMSVVERCYAWVLQNGMAARIRWENQYEQGELK